MRVWIFTSRNPPDRICSFNLCRFSNSGSVALVVFWKIDESVSRSSHLQKNILNDNNKIFVDLHIKTKWYDYFLVWWRCFHLSMTIQLLGNINHYKSIDKHNKIQDEKLLHATIYGRRISLVSFFAFFNVLLFPSEISLMFSLLYIGPIRMMYITRYFVDRVLIFATVFNVGERLISVNATVCSWVRSASLSRMTIVSLEEQMNGWLNYRSISPWN